MLISIYYYFEYIIFQCSQTAGGGLLLLPGRAEAGPGSVVPRLGRRRVGGRRLWVGPGAGVRPGESSSFFFQQKLFFPKKIVTGLFAHGQFAQNWPP